MSLWQYEQTGCGENTFTIEDMWDVMDQVSKDPKRQRISFATLRVTFWAQVWKHSISCAAHEMLGWQQASNWKNQSRGPTWVVFLFRQETAEAFGIEMRRCLQEQAFWEWKGEK